MLQKATTVQRLDPSLIIRLRDSAYATDMLVAAVAGPDFFTALSREPGSKEDICNRLGLARRPMDVMTSLFEVWDLVQTVNGKIHATEVAKTFLNADSKRHILPYITSLAGRTSVKEMETLLRNDRSADWDPTSGSDVQDWDRLMQNEAFARNYIDAMDRRGALFAKELCEVFSGNDDTRLLDIAGGSGIYTVRLLQMLPNAVATLLDRPPVDRFAAQAFEQAGLSKRTEVVASDMFVDELPAGHDHHLYSHVMHNWPSEKVRLLIKKSFQSLEPGGLLSIFGSHVNDVNDGSPAEPMAEYSVLLAFLYPGRCYGLRETADMMTEAGFVDADWTLTGFDRSVITARKP